MDGRPERVRGILVLAQITVRDGRVGTAGVSERGIYRTAPSKEQVLWVTGGPCR